MIIYHTEPSNSYITQFVLFCNGFFVQWPLILNSIYHGKRFEVAFNSREYSHPKTRKNPFRFFFQRNWRVSLYLNWESCLPPFMKINIPFKLERRVCTRVKLERRVCTRVKHTNVTERRHNKSNIYVKFQERQGQLNYIDTSRANHIPKEVARRQKPPKRNVILFHLSLHTIN